MTEALLFRLLADGVVVLHLGFILFVVFGGIAAAFRPKVLWIHVPCVIWAVFIEFSGFFCPLTPLENYLLGRSGGPTYSGDFIVHHIGPVIYPQGLTRDFQILLGTLALAINALVYLWVFSRKRKRA